MSIEQENINVQERYFIKHMRQTLKMMIEICRSDTVNTDLQREKSLECVTVGSSATV